MVGTGMELSAPAIKDGDEEELCEMRFGRVHGAGGLLGIFA
jgi:hypothetical protein